MLGAFVKGMSDVEFEKLVAEETLIVEVGEEVSRQMEKQKLSKADLAAKLPPGYNSEKWLTHFLSGDERGFVRYRGQITLRHVVKVAEALDCNVKISLEARYGS
jgi:hypothetical protein